METKVRGAVLELCSFKITRSLLKQARKLYGGPLPAVFRLPMTPEQAARLKELCEKSGTPEESQERDWLLKLTHRLDPAKCLGYVHGSVLDEEYTFFVLFVHDGDLFVWNHPGFKPEPWCKRIYV